MRLHHRHHVALLILPALAAVAAASLAAASPPRAGCPVPRAPAGYASRARAALAARRDVWGERLLRARSGPTYAAASRYLPPLLYATGPGGRPLTASGVYYLPFTLPLSAGGERGFGLHVADGSQIVVRRAGGPSVTVDVGDGRERYGSCLARLAPPRLADGWLPILRTSYVDGRGARYAQESFVARLPGRRSLVSFVHLTVEARRAHARVRLVSSRGVSVAVAARPGTTAEVYAALVHEGARLVRVDAGTYAAARAEAVSYWQDALAAGMQLDVPEPRVVAAERALLVQEIAMTWRYSVGNRYEELSFAEALDVARVTAAYGHPDVARQILRYTLRQLPARFTNWRAGERLVAGAALYRLGRDERYVAEETPGLRRVVAVLARGIAAGGLLPRERYSSDIAANVHSLAGQTLAWEGLQAMGRVWADTGRPVLAARARGAALRLQAALGRAVRASERRLPDGSRFVPVALLDGEAPYGRLTDTRAGSYWNLVAPFALASGFFRPHGPEADGLLRYLLGHGSRLIGLVRSAAYRLSPDEGSGGGGTDEVYGVNVSRFLADEDRPEQLVLSLYGILAGALTPGTYVSGEAASVAPLDGRRFRTMYLPPSNAGGAAFLETLRLALVHETRGPEGRPRGLELAFATPRGWLRSGATIALHAAPTSFGSLDYSIARRGNRVHVQLAPPASPAPETLRLRLRLPAGERLAAVELAGARISFDRATGTIDLSGRRGELELDAVVRP